MSHDDTHPDHSVTGHPNRWLALAILLIAGFMNLIDVTIVNVALPSLQRSFGATSSQIEWVVAGYVLVFALALLPFGRLGDIIGQNKLFLAGVAAFTAMSLLCGLAPNIETLVIARLLQGLAGAAMMPQVLAIMQGLFPHHERGLAFSMFGLSAGLAAVAGPVTGGFLISADLFGLDWRPIFLINLPIGIAAVLLGMRYIPNRPGNPNIKNDWMGIFLAAGSVFLLVFALIEGRSFGWPLWIYLMMAMAIPGFIAFYFWERHREKNNLSQLLPLSLLRNRNFAVGIIATMGFFSGIPGFFMILALFLQIGFGLTPLESGLTTIPFPVGILIASVVSGRFGPHFIKSRLIGGVFILILGMLFTRHTILNLGDVLDRSIFILPLFTSGLGMGITIAVMFQAILSGVPIKDAGSGSGSLQAFQQMGGAIGIAIIGEIFFSTLSTQMAAGAGQHAFIEAATNAILYDVGIFCVVALASLFLHTSAKSSSAARHIPVEI